MGMKPNIYIYIFLIRNHIRIAMQNEEKIVQVISVLLSDVHVVCDQIPTDPTFHM